MSRVLIVDDNGEIREVITILLEGEGFETEEAASGEEALRKVKEGVFDLILLDVMMPGLNGYQTCVEIRKTTNAPILFLSARSQVEDNDDGIFKRRGRLSSETFFLSGAAWTGKGASSKIPGVSGKGGRNW